MQLNAPPTRWICSEDTEEVNQYFCFRRNFELSDAICGAVLKISVNWDFRPYLNGERLNGNQFPDAPERKSRSEISLPPLRAGKNVLALLVYNPNEDFSAQLKAPDGVWGEVSVDGKILFVTDETWRVRKHTAYLSGGIAKTTLQLGYCQFYDARLEDAWTSLAYDDSEWPAAVPADYTPQLAPRPLPLLPRGERIPASPVKAAHIFRVKEHPTFARTVMADQKEFCPVWNVLQNGSLTLDAGGQRGVMLIYDLGAEFVGYLEMECRSPAGTIIDLSFGEHLDDGMVRAAIDGRNFTDRFVACEGDNHFEVPFRRMGCRYLQVNLVSPTGGGFLLKFLGLRSCNIELGAPAPFVCDDPQESTMRGIALRTLRMCMHDHYEDCPWREQSLYAYDSRNQMLFGYYAWGNYDFAATSLRLLGESFSPNDGYLNLCAPTHRSVTIPIFSMVWVTALWENCLFSGNDHLLHLFADQIVMMIAAIRQSGFTANGVLRCPDPAQYWNFAEWVPGLDGGGHSPGTEWAPHSLYFCEMLKSAALIFDTIGRRFEAGKFREEADQLGAAVEKHFADPAVGCYRTWSRDDLPRHRHTQFLMLALELASPEMRRTIPAALRHPDVLPETCSPWPYMIRGLFSLSPAARQFAISEITRVCRAMYDAGATTWFETPEGGSAFDNAGSLCHAWSAVQPYLQGAYYLGVRPLRPGFASFEVNPYPCHLTHAEGEIPTPHGRIRVAWRKGAGNRLQVTVTHPKGTQAFPGANIGDFRCSQE